MSDGADDELLQELEALQKRRGGIFQPDVDELLARRPEFTDAWRRLQQEPGVFRLPNTAALGDLFQRVLAIADDDGGRQEKVALLRQALADPVLPHLPSTEGVIRLQLGTLLSQSTGAPAQIEESVDQHRKAAKLLEGRDADAAEMNQAHLAIALMRLRTGDAESANAEAVRILESLIERSESPTDVARYKSNLAVALLGSPQARSRDNVERALSMLKAVRAAVASDVADPDVLLNVGNALAQAEFGDRRRNIEQAILCYDQAMPAYDPVQDPDRYGAIRLMLCSALTERWGEERMDALARIDALIDEVLAVYRPGFYTERWADAKTRQAGRFLEMPELTTEQAAGSAVTSLSNALDLCPRASYPHDWAKLTLNLANIVLASSADRSTILDAIERLYDAVAVYGRRTFPRRWGQVHHCLGALWARLAVQGADVDSRAREHLELALSVRSPEQQPADYLATMTLLARLEMHAGDFAAAHELLDPACAAARELTGGADTTAGRRRQAAETWAAFQDDAECLLRLKRPAEAVTRLEQGRAQVLRGALTDPSFGSAAVARPGQLAIDEILERVLGARPAGPHGGTDPDDPSMAAPHGGAFVAVISTPRGTAAVPFISGRGRPQIDDCLWLGELTTALIDEWLGVIGGGGWLGAYSRRHEAPEVWQQAIADTTADLWEFLAGPLTSFLTEHGLAHGADVVLALPGKLARWPVHASWTMRNGAHHFFLDDWTVSYAPSALARRVSASRATERRLGAGALIVANPTLDLYWADVECNALAGMFAHDVDLLQGEAADADAVLDRMSGKQFIHFACHGSFDWDRPFDSRLVLAKGTNLLLSTVVAERDLLGTRLVTLSACETGVAETTFSENEYLGLPAAYLVAGAAGVISSLWVVQDKMACDLMIEFYRYLLTESQAQPAAALRQAQLRMLGHPTSVGARVSAQPDRGISTASEQPPGAASSDWSWAAVCTHRGIGPAKERLN